MQHMAHYMHKLAEMRLFREDLHSSELSIK
jgi:hypothetical protein